MNVQEYHEWRREQRLEKLFDEVNLAIMVKRGEDAYDEGTPEEQQARADAKIIEGEKFIASLFDGCDPNKVVLELRKDTRIVGNVSLFKFSKYAQIMAKVMSAEDSRRCMCGFLPSVREEFDKKKSEFEAAQAKIDDIEKGIALSDKEIEQFKSELAVERKRLGLDGEKESHNGDSTHKGEGKKK